MVGCGDGTLVGLPVGTRVLGDLVGLTVVGVPVGGEVGVVVGTAVGALVSSSTDSMPFPFIVDS